MVRIRGRGRRRGRGRGSRTGRDPGRGTGMGIVDGVDMRCGAVLVSDAWGSSVGTRMLTCPLPICQ